MYRRRRPPPREVAFSFDSFLDLVANVIGIIIRLMLVAWVGARTYQSTMESALKNSPAADTVPARPLPKDPLQRDLEQTRRDLELARASLFEKIRTLEVAQGEKVQAESELSLVTAAQKELDAQLTGLDRTLLTLKSSRRAVRGLPGDNPEFTMAELRRRRQEVLKQIQDIKKLPSLKKVLRYHTPVSKPVVIDELEFECRNGRVTFIDLKALLAEMNQAMRDKIDRLREAGDIKDVAGPIGAFRLHYLMERRDTPNGYGYDLSGWILEPVVAVRGETLEQALGKDSEFQVAVSGAVPGQTAVTFWVYPESFGLFRQLRDLLYERGLEVAGRPMTPDAPMGASRNGTQSRGQ